MGFSFKKKTASKDTRKVLPVIFAVDTSSKMGDSLVAINNTVNSIIKSFAEYNSARASDKRIEVAILGGSHISSWLTIGLEKPESMSTKWLTSCFSLTLDAMLEELNTQLATNKLFDEKTEYLDPFICFITSDLCLEFFTGEISNCLGNPYFLNADKAAIVIGKETHIPKLSNIVGSDNIVHLQSGSLIGRVLTGLCTHLGAKPSVVSAPISVAMPPLSSSQAQAVPPANSSQYGGYDFSLGATVPSSHTFSDASRTIETDEADDTASPFSSQTAACSGSTQGAYKNSSYHEEINMLYLRDSDYDVSPWLDDFAAAPLPRHEQVDAEYGIPNSFDVSAEISEGGGDDSKCPICHSKLSDTSQFCSACGAKIPPRTPKNAKISDVQFSAVVPKSFTKGDYSMIDITVYEEEYRSIVDAVIANADTEVKEVIGSAQSVSENTMIKIVLTSPDIPLSDCEETQKWQGKFLTYSFPVEIPENYEKKQTLFIATVYFNGIIATKLKFIASCTSLKEQKPELTREDVLTAFISYASQDRTKVATIIQGMKKARPDMDIFFDVESLRSGEEWEKVLMREIENRDVLFLCWSPHAKESKWVETEWKYALSNKGLEAIEPIPLVSPAVCPPPEELSSKHFNDRALLYNSDF